MKKESVYSYAEMQEMQSQPLDVKIAQARKIVLETFKHGGKIALAFSGGERQYSTLALDP